jgi:hypothetical protein
MDSNYINGLIRQDSQDYVDFLLVAFLMKATKPNRLRRNLLNLLGNLYNRWKY